MRRFWKATGRTARYVLVGIGALALIAGGVRAANNYLATVPGSGTSFAGILISAVVHPVVLICDATLGEAQCAAVNSSGSLQVNPVGVTQGSSTSGQTQSLTGCATLTAVAAYSGTTTNPCTNDIVGNMRSALQATTWGGAQTKHFIAANSDNATNLKASAGMVYAIKVGNIGTVPYFLKLYNTSTTPTCGSSTVADTFIIPPNNSGANASLPVGKYFSTGISYCVVTNIADTDDTSVPATTVTVNIDWN